MNITDLIVIYLACGSPLGVYFFLNNHLSNRKKFLLTKTIFAVLLWLPFAGYLLLKKSDFKKAQFSSEINEKKILYVRKQIEAILLETNSSITIFNFREIVERYVGLSSVIFNENTEITNSKKEIFEISHNSNIQLATICYNRRNRKRLRFHHISARQDFLNVIFKMSKFSSDKNKLGNLSGELIELINDFEARKSLQKIFANPLQISQNFAVNNSEKDLWNPETPKPLPISQISTQLQSLSATNLQVKD